MRNGESASYGCAAHVALRMSKSSIIIEGIMARPAIHPGEILAEELAETAVTPTELARQLKVPANRITQIIQGKRAISGDTALRLGHWLAPSPSSGSICKAPTISAWPLGRRVRRSRGS